MSITNDDLMAVIEAHLKKHGVLSHHLKSFNRMTSIGISQIIRELFVLEGSVTPENNETIKNVSFEVKFTKVNLKKSTRNAYFSGKEELKYPYTARNIDDSTYTSQLSIDAVIKATAIIIKDGVETEETREDSVKDFIIAAIPIMVGSNLCNTYNTPRDVLLKMRMDPDSAGGYFIVKGKEWAIDNYESVIFNQFRVFNNKHQNELTRGEFLSKPGDSYENSYETIIRLLNNNMITVSLSIAQFKIQSTAIQIPFYIIFRILGITTDKEIMDYIVYGFDGTSESVKTIVYNAFIAKDNTPKKTWVNALDARDQNRAIIELASKLTDSYAKLLDEPNEDKIKTLHSSILKTFDYQFLPHVGTKPEHRRDKARFLGYMINTLIKTHLEVIPPNDRDSYRNKRIHPAGEGYSKILKTFFNYSVVQILKRGYRRAFETTPFHQVNLVNVFKYIKQSQLEKALIQSITTGNKDITSGSRRLPNRLSSQMIHWKNDLNVIATMRTITTGNSSVQKGTARAYEMRAVHPSSIGYICPSQSPDTGEKVGLQKQMAVTAIISLAGSSILLKDKIMEDKRVIPSELCPNKRMYEEKLYRIFVNGIWIGCVQNTYQLAEDFREKRRNKQIDRFTTIYWDNMSNQVYFYCDAGRFLRPLLIVNHKTNGKKFHQELAITKKDINAILDGKLDMDDLLENKMVEYISPEEQENCMIAPDHDFLLHNQNNELMQYTHCEIPQSVVGLPALTSAKGHHNQGPRITFQTNQSKQTNGIFAKDWPYVFQKGSVIAHNSQKPIIKTIANDYTLPNGENCIIAIMLCGGWNQEDSNIINQGSVDMDMFGCSYFTYEKTELGKDERFGIPNAIQTLDRKNSYANYEKIDGYTVKPGTIVYHNDVIIAKYALIKDSDKLAQGKIYADKSIVWKYDEPAEVVEIAPEGNMVNEEGKRFVKVKFRAYRPVMVGDKFSTRSGQKMVCAKMVKQVDMPFTKNGMSPDLIMGPFSFPKRMTNGQPLEQNTAKLCAYNGTTADGTIFKSTNIDEIRKGLKEIGFNEFGNEILFNGKTGQRIDTAIFVGPCYVQRLQKFVNDTIFAVSDARTCPITHQPLDGKSCNGGLRLGRIHFAAVLIFLL